MSHIAFDWDGTIAKKEVAEEASIRRCKTLDIKMTSEKMQELQKTHAHYDINRQRILEYTGIKDERTQTIIMTNLFQLHYVGVVNEWKDKIFYPGMKEAITKLKKQGHTLSIITTLRTDIIEPALEALGMRNIFGKVYGNTPDLIYSKEELAKQALTDCKEVHLVVGDREEDLMAGRAVKAKTAFAQWGHGELKDKKLADAILKTPEDILKFAKTL
ncbi:Phosphoglycolate phosphatase [uncultured archaeon]|nr:Phosphoglycolate phosphatase [uncultured archaeon]